MRKPAVHFALLLTLSLGLFAGPIDPRRDQDQANCDAFVQAHFNTRTAPPFRFSYNGQESLTFLSKWASVVATRTLADRTVTEITYTDPTAKLRVSLEATSFLDFPAVEWVVRFKNESRTETPIIGDVLACAVKFDGWSDGPIKIYRARGSSAERSDFAPITETLPENAEVHFGPSAGRSSDTTAMPFFNIARSRGGIVAALGWSGRWKVAVKRPDTRSLVLEAGQNQTHFRLQPGEAVRTPSIALLFWKSADRMAGHNLFRRFVLAHHTPRPQGKPVELPLSAGVGFGGPFPCNEYACATESYALAMMDRLSQFGIRPDDCWIDAGWYENANKTWWTGVGNWTVNRENFPRGLKPVTEAARRRGQGFVLWFEPERVYEGTRLDREHPDWMTKLPGNPNRLLNLGDPKIVDWLIDYISKFLLSEGVTVYRQDFNFDPAPYWEAMDTPDRVGLAEMKHIEGLYAFWDGLLARVPGLLIDNCASGGRRIDLETIGRSVPLWRTDYSYFEPNGYQCHTYGLHMFLPCSGTGNNNPQKYYFRSSMSGAVVLGWELNASFNNAQALEDIAEFRDIRPYFYGDFYPLTEYSTSDESWAVFQWDRPESGDGIILAFRRNLAVGPTVSVSLQGLDPDRDYELSFEDYGLSFPKKGSELLSGLSLKIPEAPGSLLIKYRVVGR